MTVKQLSVLLSLPLFALSIYAAADPAPTIVVPAGQTVKITLEYVYTAGTAPLTLALPVVIPTAPVTPPPSPPVPPVPPPSPGLTPVINEYRDAARQSAIATIAGGTLFWIDGTNFGAAPGQVQVNTGPLVISHWEDTRIEATAPPYIAAANPGMWSVIRADGGQTVFLGMAVTAPPPK